MESGRSEVRGEPAGVTEVMLGTLYSLSGYITSLVKFLIDKKLLHLLQGAYLVFSTYLKSIKYFYKCHNFSTGLP